MADPVGRLSPPPPARPLERRKSGKRELVSGQLFLILFEKAKFERGFHSLTDDQLKQKQEELQGKISQLSAKLTADDIQEVQEQIQKLSNSDLQEA
jgi:hypothetical protein